jgi:hypothetical protein
MFWRLYKKQRGELPMKRVLVLMMPLFLFLAACSSTNVTNSWKDKDISAASFRKVLVVAMLPEKDRDLRQQMEDEMVDDLAKRGYAALSAYAEYGPKAFAGMSEKQVLQQLDRNKIDGVITVSLLNTEQSENYVPGSVRYEPYAVVYNRFYRTYQTYYNRTYTPGYTDRQTNYFFETNLYDVNSNKLLYSAQSKSFDPSSASQIANEVSKAVVKDMQKNGILTSTIAKH